MVKIIESGNNVELYTPYSKDFVAEIKNIGGSRWNVSKKCWTIPKEALDFAKDAMLRIYGDNGDEKQATLTVKLTFGETKYSQNREAYTLMGKTIARATGRDSGAYPCEDSIFEAGKPNSGGSKVNWYTTIPSGCVVRLSNVSTTMWKEFIESEHEGITAEICEDKVDREALELERKKLLKRLAEIDNILGGNTNGD